MLNTIINNPFRILGVFANAPKKDIIASKGKLFAFARIGKQIPCATNLSSLLPDITRTADNLMESENKLSLAKDIAHYAQFWFVNDSCTDKNALSFIENNQKDKAINAWKENSLVSSLHNRIVYCLIVEDYVTAFICAEILYSTQLTHYKTLFNDCMSSMSGKELFYSFCETIYHEDILDDNKWNDIHNNCKSQEYKECINHIRAYSHVNTINDAILVAKSKSNEENAFDVGSELVSKTNDAVDILEKVLSRDNAQCQLTFDKLANAILGHGIDYYNSHLSEYKVANKVLPLFQRSYDLAVSKMQLERSKSNLDTIKSALVPEVKTNNNIEGVKDIKSLLMPIFHFDSFYFGVSTINDMRSEGCDIDDSDNEYITTDYQDVGLASTDGLPVFNSIVLYSWRNSYEFNCLGLREEHTYKDLKDKFEKYGFSILITKRPEIVNGSNGLKYFSAGFKACDFNLNIQIVISIFTQVENYVFYASEDQIVRLSSVRIEFDREYNPSFISWYHLSKRFEKSSFIYDFTHLGLFTLGNTTNNELKIWGADIEDDDMGWISISYKNCSIYDNDKKGIPDEIWWKPNDCKNLFERYDLNSKRNHDEWINFFNNFGFATRVYKQPDVRKATYGDGYCYSLVLKFTEYNEDLEFTVEIDDYSMFEYKNPHTHKASISRITVLKNNVNPITSYKLDDENSSKSKLVKFLSPFVKNEDFTIGETTSDELDDAGYEIEDNRGNKNAEIWVYIDDHLDFCYRADYDEYQSLVPFDDQSLNEEKTFTEWTEYFEEMGFDVKVTQNPYVISSGRYISAAFEAEYEKYNIKLYISIFHPTTSSIYTQYDLVAINEIQVSMLDVYDTAPYDLLDL